MSDESLWERSAGPGGESPDDKDVRRLEALLRPLAAPLPPAPSAARLERSRVASAPSRSAALRAGFLAPALAAAAAIVVMIASLLNRAPTAESTWEVARMDGVPHIETASTKTPLSGSARIAVGETLATDAAARASMSVSTIGQVTVDNNTRVRLVGTRAGRHELALERGTLHAFITAPPGQFIVNTPSSTATDLGCVYTLHVDEDGTGLLSVRTGWVAFEYKGRESFVPARAAARTDPEFGPGTPRYDDTDGAFKDALERFDYGRSAEAKAAALAYVLERARDKDAMTIWHLLARVGESDRPAVIAALDRRAPMPVGVTEDAIQHLNRAALDLWWDALGLRDATWWRKWKGPYPALK